MIRTTSQAVFLFCVYLIFASAAFAQSVISEVAPSSAEVGAGSVTIDFTLPTNPNPPPANVMPTSVTIGDLVGADFSRDGQYHLAATFDIGADVAAGNYDVAIVFTTPMGELTFSATAAFTVIDAAAPPVVTLQPASQTIPLGQPATLTCAVSSVSAVTYQWIHRETEIDGATNADLVIDAVEQSNGGPYYCVITNEFGFVETNVAVLTIFSDKYLPSYAIVDTNQTSSYDNTEEIASPLITEPFAGQDGQFTGNQPLYSLNNDGLTVYDNITRLTWTQTADTNHDGVIDIDDKMTLPEAEAFADALNEAVYGGYDDWRVPTIKEIYSLMDFTGIDASGQANATLKPFIDTDYFGFGYGDEANGERLIDAQFITNTAYVGKVFDDRSALFGLNLADGRIKGYPSMMDFYVLFVRGNTDYGVNQFLDNGDGTITDIATGLMWEKADSGEGLNWEDALAYAMDNEKAGYRDWRLPNAKELHSILDYTRAPEVTESAAIDPVFDCTEIYNEEGDDDFPWYWSSTTFLNSSEEPAGDAVYFCFGRAMGFYDDVWTDVHGAGAQRGDPKSGVLTNFIYAPDGYYSENAPQGDAVRIFNFVRCVRGGARPPFIDTDEDSLPDWYEYDYTGSTTEMEADADGDGDLVSNLDEFRAGTIPDDAESFFELQEFALGDEGATLTWRSELDRYYVVMQSTDLVEFEPLSDIIKATPPSNTFDVAPDSEAVFYRVYLSPSPSSGGMPAASE